MIVAVFVGIAGSIGSVSRYLIDGFVQDRVSGAFPFGTNTVNVSGSFILGVTTGLLWYHGLPSHDEVILGVGFCGGLTTWSTASWEIVRLAEEGLPAKALSHALLGLAASIATAALGIGLAALL
jgi:CrcB protein